MKDWNVEVTFGKKIAQSHSLTRTLRNEETLSYLLINISNLK